jgi:hypothetical protein
MVIDNKDIDDLIEELERLTIKLSLKVEEDKINKYFDEEYSEYVLKKMCISPIFGDKIMKIIESIKENKAGLLVEYYENNDLSEEANLKANLKAMEKFFLPHIDIKKNKKNKQQTEFVYSIGIDKFVESILETYKSDTEIINQFLCDFFRQKITVNDVKYENIDELFLCLSKNNYKTKIVSKYQKNMSSFIFMLLLTCQSSHYLSYLYPHKVLENIKKKNNDEDVKNYYVMSSGEFNTTNLYTSDFVEDIIQGRQPEFGCMIESSYKILNTDTCEKLYDIKAKTFLTENSERCIIKYEIMKS